MKEFLSLQLARIESVYWRSDLREETVAML